jgi:hypothetical protein
VSSDSEDENEPERALDERFAALVSHGRSFIEESTALLKLREELKNFIGPPRVNGGFNNESVSEARSWVQKWIHSVSPKTLGLGLRYEALGWMTRESLVLKRFLSRLGLLEEVLN